MKSFLVSFMLFLAAFDCSSQDSSNFRKHKLEFYPVSLTINKAFFIGQSIKYTYSLSPDLYIDMSTDGVWFRQLDGRKNWFSKDEKFPFFNQTKLLVGYNFNDSKKIEKKNTNDYFGIRLGYHYLQHGTQNGDYWQIDTTSIGENRFISGFKTHSFSAGIKYHWNKRIEKNNSKIQKISHTFYADYILGVTLNLMGNIEHLNSFTASNLNNIYNFQRNGFCVGYNFSHSISTKINFHSGIEFLWSPFIDYHPNYSFHVPRGGEKIHPRFINLKIGLGF